MDEKELDELMVELSALLEGKDFRQLKDRLCDLNPADAAEFLETLPDKEMLMVFRTLHKDMGADVFSYLPAEAQEKLLTTMTDKEASAILDDMFVDDAVDALDELPANVVEKLLRFTTPETRRTINLFLHYPDDSAGSIMTTEFVRLKKEWTVDQAFQRIRQVGLDSEMVYTCYVTDANRNLEGVVTVRKLFLTSLDTLIGDVMETEVIYAHTTDDQVEVAQLISKYDFISLPVVDQENRLVGIVTVDDIIDVIQEENTEDFEKMAAMRPSQKVYLKTGVFEMARNRVPWLLILMVSATVTGRILGSFEESISLLPVLVTFIPMLMDTGGNSGAQSSTMIIRGMALGEIENRDVGKVLWKEIRVAMLCGLTLAAVNCLRLIIFNRGLSLLVIFVVCMSLVIAVMIAKTIGALLPIAAKKLGGDPAIMASPMITTIVDACTLFVYFNLARQILSF
ncbi:MAG: magnesium transporter [Clostridiales bacterium]|nr:magnesium transporter [Clostridiales bacterium]